MDCLTLLLEDRMAENALYRAVLSKLYALWPPAYHRYYLRGPDSGEPFLTYREWRAVMDETAGKAPAPPDHGPGA